MAQEKDERASASAKKAGETGDDTAKRILGAAGRPMQRESQRESGNGGNGNGNGNGGTAPTAPATRRERYLIGARALVGAQAFGNSRQSMDGVVDYLSRQEHIEIIKRIKLGGVQPFAADGGSVNEVVVARIEDSRAERLRAATPAELIIERDAFLNCADSLSIPVHSAALGAMLPLGSVATDLAIRVVGERDQPLAKTTVLIYGLGLPVQALTDETGTARITYFGGPVESVQALCIKPAAGFWDRFVAAPRLNSSGVSTVRLRPLAELLPNFPGEPLVGWGQRLMRLDSFGGGFTGSGVRIGIIDSGCDTSHPQLRHITRGKDFCNGGSDTTWTDDAISHGTHCAGIISAASTGQGVNGFAPGAEVHVFKVFPGGRVSDLLAALDECIERELDVVNISVGCDGISGLVGQKLQQARQKGVACIVAAGNSAGPVGFPALLPTVMAVGAVGKLKEFPSDSCHAQTVIPQLVGGDGIFAARFSCVGPQVAVTAPGVAVVSTVPGGGYAAIDGTSAAASHVTGLAALVLAHHPLFQGAFRTRSEQRVQALFGLIQASAVQHFLDPLRGGAGVPDLQRIPGEQGLGFGLQGLGLPGADPFASLLSGPSGGVPTYSPMAAYGWQQTLMQMRAAGFL
jgi:subtilisin